MKTQKTAAPPARGFLRQKEAATFCGVSVDTVQRATRLFEASEKRYGLKSRQAGRLVLYAVVDLVAWIDAGMPTGIHAVKEALA